MSAASISYQPVRLSDISPDYGTEGLAAMRRPSRTEPVATGSTAIGRESSDRKRFEDEHLIDRMHRCSQLSTRQYEAALRFLEMWVAAGIAAPMVPRYGAVSCRATGDGDIDEPTAKDRYRRLARTFHGHRISLLETAMLGHHPGTSRLATLQAVLDDLAKIWGID